MKNPNPLSIIIMLIMSFVLMSGAIPEASDTLPTGVPSSERQSESDIFSIPAPSETVKLARTKMELSTKPHEYRSEVFPLDQSQSIHGLSVTGEFSLVKRLSNNDPNAFVRVVLLADDGQEYLAYQKLSEELSDHEAATSKMITIEAVCEETCVMPRAVKPLSLRLEARHAAITVSSISSVDAPVSGDPDELRRQQNAAKIRKINAQNPGWIAGETSVSNLTYAEKKTDDESDRTG